MSVTRKLVVVLRIDAPWPDGSADLSDAINRIVTPVFAKGATEYVIVAGYEPKGGGA